MSRGQYTAQEYANMHLIYGECKCNASEAAVVYKKRYPKLRHPDYRVFIGVHFCYAEGRIPGSGVSDRGRIADIKTENVVLKENDRDASISIREIAQRRGISKSTVYRILARNERLRRVERTSSLESECEIASEKSLNSRNSTRRRRQKVVVEDLAPLPGVGMTRAMRRKKNS